MSYNVSVGPGDMIVVPPDSGAQIRVVEKSGRRTQLAIDSAKPVSVLKANANPAANAVDRPAVATQPNPLLNRPTA